MAFFESAMRIEAEEMKKLQQEYQKLAGQRTMFESQLTENKIVKEEMELLDEDTNVFKLVGPVLVKQELSDSRQTVDKRIEFISREVKRTETTMTEMEAQMQEKREKMYALQQQFAQVSAQQKQAA